MISRHRIYKIKNKFRIERDLTDRPTYYSQNYQNDLFEIFMECTFIYYYVYAQ